MILAEQELPMVQSRMLQIKLAKQLRKTAANASVDRINVNEEKWALGMWKTDDIAAIPRGGITGIKGEGVRATGRMNIDD